MGKTCSAFGHREIYGTEKLKIALTETLTRLIEQGYTEFLTGDMGAFDRLFSCAVREAKKEHPHIKLVCIKPYITKELRENKEYYYDEYDEIIIPQVCAESPPKYAITKRNRWMVDQSELVLFYVFKHYGGAFNTKDYAQKHHKEIMELSDVTSNLQKAVGLMDDEWLDSLTEMEDYAPSKKHKEWLRQNFGVDFDKEIESR